MFEKEVIRLEVLSILHLAGGFLLAGISIYLYRLWRLFRGGMFDQLFRLGALSGMLFALAQFIGFLGAFYGIEVMETVYELLELIVLAAFLALFGLLARRWRKVAE